SNIPLFPTMMEGKVKDPAERKALDYWFALQDVSTWLALPPATPKPIVDAYRAAYARLAADAEFMEHGRKLAEEFTLQTATDLEKAVMTLDSTPKETLDYISEMLRRQGAGSPI